MFHTLLVFCLSSWLLGVFGDEVKSVSVMEGESVTLHTDLTHIQTDDVIEWRFENIRITRIKRSFNINPTYDDDTEIFRDKLKMNNQTGDLTITHITSQHSGLYQLNILGRNKDTVKKFSLTVHDKVKSVSVMEGDPFTLHTDLTHIQTDDVIEWRFKDIRIARIKRSVSINPTYDETEIFRDKLKMNNQTGDLTITHITSQHSGLYQLNILGRNKDTVKRLSLTVHAQELHTSAGGQSDYIIPLSCAVVGSVMIVAAPLMLLMFFICRKHTNTHQQDQTCADSTYNKTQTSEMTELVYTSIKPDDICTKGQFEYFSEVQYNARTNKRLK
ncbi:uncharacterized protein LOC130429838 [Triplophysa dalaica]|uniref:uncharacterized protein LOC130429838 n=1 Tax=Triplophysa dalaica TaxID=1582913 RepID=UPI0024DF5578|nr:uncharacterized protein LOC130429838 [Triplophysa dalaica]